MKRLIMLVFLLSAIVLPYSASASGLCCQVSSGVQENLMGVASPEANKFSLQMTYSFTRMDKLREGTAERSVGDIVNAGKYTVIPTAMDMTKYTVTSAYSFSRGFSLFASIPYVRNTMGMTHLHGDGEWENHVMNPVNNIGDITVMGLYRPYVQSEDRVTDTLSVGLGVKTPTGSYTEMASTGYVHAHMQPGSGSWDPLMSVIYTKMMGSFLIQTDAAYQLATRNPEGYRFGDSFTANLTGTYRATENFNAVAGLIYLQVNKANDRDGKYTNTASLMDNTANTGGDSIWISPGLQWSPVKNSLIDLKVQLPVWERVNGVQLVSTYRILAGISYSF